MKESMKVCPICESGQLHENVDDNVVEYKGVERFLPLYYSVCDACGSEQGDASQTRKNKQAMQAFRKEIDGLLTGEQIKELRKQYTITQTQAANIFGGGPVAFSKYEANDVVQSEAMDNLLRVAKAVPKSFAWLAKRAGEHDVWQKIMQKVIPEREQLMQRNTLINPSARHWKQTPSNASIYGSSIETECLLVVG